MKPFLSKIIYENKLYLAQTDYIAIKYFEGELNEEEFAPIKEKRQQARQKIREAEAEYKECRD